MDLPVLDIFIAMESCNMWPFVSFCPTYNNAFKVHWFCSMYQCFISFCGWMSLYWHTKFFVGTFVDGCLCFHFNTTTMNICVWVFMWTWVFISLGYIPGSGIAGLYCNFMFSPLRNCQTYPKWLHYFTFLPAVYEFQFLPIFAKTFISLWF